MKGEAKDVFFKMCTSGLSTSNPLDELNFEKADFAESASSSPPDIQLIRGAAHHLESDKKHVPERCRSEGNRDRHRHQMPCDLFLGDRKVTRVNQTLGHKQNCIKIKCTTI